MGLEFLAAIVAAIACAGLGLIAGKLSGGRLPKWTVPFAAGLGLIGYTAWSEYSWYGRVSGSLPEGVEVISVMQDPQALRPWTFLVPMARQFVAADTRSLVPHPANPDLILARVYGFARWQGVKDGFVVVDCGGAQSVMLTETAVIGDDGKLSGAEWQAADEMMLGATCRKG